jgi:c(7)-type cytochrome triheme protein
MRRWIAVLAVSAVVAIPAFADQAPAKKRRPLPPEFGRVILNNGSEKAGLAPVSFDHWYHRAKYTCRVCHVDVGFAMKAGATNIKAADNQAGFYCGACHNGKLVVDKKKVFESCGKALIGENRPTCLRCHSVGKNVTPMYDFNAFTKNLPKGRFGNGVDWEKAEEEKLIQPSDFLEGVSIPRKSFTAQKDFALSAKLQGMPDIIFSHQKHTVWNGCELCHPEIFVGVKKGATKYSMVEIFDGKYCGACHVTVAFPLIDCGRCHSRPVQ